MRNEVGGGGNVSRGYKRFPRHMVHRKPCEPPENTGTQKLKVYIEPFKCETANRRRTCVNALCALLLFSSTEHLWGTSSRVSPPTAVLLLANVQYVLFCAASLHLFHCRTRCCCAQSTAHSDVFISTCSLTRLFQHAITEEQPLQFKALFNKIKKENKDEIRNEEQAECWIALDQMCERVASSISVGRLGSHLDRAADKRSTNKQPPIPLAGERSRAVRSDRGSV
ncbi:hypothetical protein ANN_15572 [Periplaneta americana]|uniref:Uncharacterized protein n=1 Tax=Periplaneta americana TaxID=6978 RepID=A0ABQ8SH56_PERAM|nr:hypothetical protein ANN_15572 [Periplaneta americana]